MEDFLWFSGLQKEAKNHRNGSANVTAEARLKLIMDAFKVGGRKVAAAFREKAQVTDVKRTEKQGHQSTQGGEE